MSNDQVDIEVRPEPTDEELAAIIAALEFLEVDAAPEPEVPKSSAWSRTARLETMRRDLTP